ncbi:MAG: hypothetical protein JXR58_03405, partial [Bacteroidales bacterium]|nr:hypothetical protein [Bacteroidales bacterium]
MCIILLVFSLTTEAQNKRGKAGKSKSGIIELNILKKKPGRKKSNIKSENRKGVKYSFSGNKSRYKKYTSGKRSGSKKSKNRYYSIKRKSDNYSVKKISKSAKKRAPKTNPRKYSTKKVRNGKTYSYTGGNKIYSDINVKKNRPNSIRLFAPKKGPRPHSNKNTLKRTKRGKTYSVSTSQNRYKGLKKTKKREKPFTIKLFNSQKKKRQHANRNTQKVKKNGKIYSVSKSTKLYGKGNNSSRKGSGLDGKRRLRKGSILKYLSFKKLLKSGQNRSSGYSKIKRKKGKKYSVPNSNSLYKKNNETNRKNRISKETRKKKFARSSSKKLHRSAIKRKNKVSRKVKRGDSDYSRLNKSLTKRRTQ